MKQDICRLDCNGNPACEERKFRYSACLPDRRKKDQGPEARGQKEK